MSPSPQPKKKQAPAPIRPSSSIVLLSPSNQVLLLHRVKTSSSFAAAHVFPGGNLDAFHDGDLPDTVSPEVHRDSPAYRLGAIRECFEETGILLARRKSSPLDPSLLSLPETDREAARRRVHDNKVRFGDWVDSVGGVPDVNSLRPFTRWVTPANVGRRFTTQMYLYMMPLAAAGATEEQMVIPTPDGGVEHTAALFDDAKAWLDKAASGDHILFPPQVFLLHLVARFCRGDAPPAGGEKAHYAAQRAALVEFLQSTPTAERGGKAAEHPTAGIAWADKVMSPYNLFIRESDNRIVLGLDRPGPELRGTARGGDHERVVLAQFSAKGPRRVEIRGREEAFQEEKKWNEQKAKSGEKESKL